MGRKAEGWERRRDFEALALPHIDALYRFVVHRVKDAHHAEDLVQEACLKAYRSFEGFERGTDFKAWLFRILVNTVLDFQRKASRGPREVSLETGEGRLNPSIKAESSCQVDPEEQLMTGELAQQLRSAVEALPQEWRDVVLLSFVEGFRYKEIAAILGCPIGTVMSRLYRARQVLRQRLEGYLSERDGGGERLLSKGKTVTTIDFIHGKGKRPLRKKEG